MKDNLIRTTTETQEDDNGGAVDMRDNGDGRQGQRRRQRRMSTVTEMRDNRYGYGGGGYAGRQQKRCGTMEMAKWVVRTVKEWENIDRERLPT